MTDVGEYCRQVEAYLTRVNGGHLVRVVGPGFVLVRQWADEGIPLTAVYRGIDQKAERHRAGASRRPLRIEFCEADVRDVYDVWRRSIGVATQTDTADADEVDRGSGSARRSPTRDLTRAIERLTRLGGRMDLPDVFRDEVQAVLDRVIEIREQVKHVRGEARQQVLSPLRDLDTRLVAAAQAAVPTAERDALEREATSDLAAYRDRLTGDAWQAAITVTVQRGVRAYFALPELSEIGDGTWNSN